MNNKLFRDDHGGSGGVDVVAARNKAIVDLLSAAGASVSAVKMAIRQSDGSLLQSTTETISADEYAHETDPEGWAKAIHPLGGSRRDAGTRRPAIHRK